MMYYDDGGSVDNSGSSGTSGSSGWGSSLSSGLGSLLNTVANNPIYTALLGAGIGGLAGHSGNAALSGALMSPMLGSTMQNMNKWANTPGSSYGTDENGNPRQGGYNPSYAALLTQLLASYGGALGQK